MPATPQHRQTNDLDEGLNWCLSEIIPIGDDFYYATLYSRREAPQQVICCSLLTLILNSGLSVSDISVRSAKLHWWHMQLAQLDKQLTQLDNHTAFNQQAFEHGSDHAQLNSVSELSHPLLRWLLHYQRNSDVLSSVLFVQACQTLIQSMITNHSLDKGWIALPPNSLLTALENAMSFALGNAEKVSDNDALARYWLIHFLSQKYSPNSTTSHYLNELKELLRQCLSQQKSSHLSLSARSYLSLAALWLKVNRTAASRGHWYEPAAPRKLFTVWKTRLFTS